MCRTDGSELGILGPLRRARHRRRGFAARSVRTGVRPRMSLRCSRCRSSCELSCVLGEGVRVIEAFLPDYMRRYHLIPHLPIQKLVCSNLDQTNYLEDYLMDKTNCSDWCSVV